MAVRQLHPLFVAELTGIDLAASIDEKAQGEIERTMDRYAVTVLPGQNLDDETETAFAALYGPLEVSPPVHSKHGGPAAQMRIRNPNIFDVSNLDESGKI